MVKSKYFIKYMTNNPTLTIVDYEKRKKLGIFYTPLKLTEILCEWAIRDPSDLIFEPSFGGCGFLESSHQRLKQLRNEIPIKQLYGCDIDESAFQKYLLPKYQIEDSLIMKRFKKDDFLNLTVNDFSVEGFSSVVGNPPYISYHKMSKEQRLSARLITKDLELSIDGRASLWAYFTLHSLSFLKKGGRLAFVLPGIFLHSNYSRIIREKISSKFNRAVVFQIGERLFSSEGTEENTTILFVTIP